jgi:hypothetical protein
MSAERGSIPEGFVSSAIAVLSPAHRCTLARCALVSGCDEAMYEAVLRVPGGPRLTELLRERTLEPQPGVRGDYRVALSLREAAWRSWWPAGADEGSVPDDLAAFAAGVARYCQRAKRPEDALRALAVCDEAAAAAEFDRLYRQRDGDGDLTGCRDLLDVLYELSMPDHSPPLGPRLVALRNDRTRYLNARYLWDPAFVPSLRYLERPAIESFLFDLVVTEPKARALRLRASGGMGKSMTLRWFIVRQCVPEPRRVPCALIDLDVVDPVNATRHPWLVLLEIAGQLNVQMEGAPFQELLREHGMARELLRPTQEDLARSGAVAIDSASASVDAEDVRFRFFATLQEDSSRTPVVVAVDTFEDAVLRGTDPIALVEMLADLHDASPRIRLILSGRLSGEEERLPVLGERLPHLRMPDVVFGEFNDAECRRYLTEVRGVEDRDLVEVIVNRAGGLPWQVALFADYVQYFPDPDRQTLQRVDPELAYCIDRIVGRITGRTSSDALQWLVRYAVVARRLLRRDFAQRVLLPRVAEGLRGTDADRPERDALPPGSVEVFRHGVMPPAEAVWDDLLRYAAGDSSWVRSAPSDPDTVILSPSVVLPLRGLLVRQPVHRLLHQDAARYYEELARADPVHWPTWAKEALYHRFQADGAGAVRAWRAAVNEARAAHRPDWVAALADEILDPEYALADAQIRAEALVERAWGMAQQAHDEQLPGADRRWSIVQHSLDEARALAVDGSGVDLSESRWRIARAALHLARTEPQKAVWVIRPVADSEEVSSDRCGALMLCAEALHLLGRHEESTDALRSARRLARRLGDMDTVARLALTLSEDAAARRRYDEAHIWALTAASEHPAGGLFPRAGATQAALALRLGCPATAARSADVPPEADHGLTCAELHAQALLALGRPQAAVQACARARAGAAVPRDRAAALWALQGCAAAEALEIDEALECLVTARGMYARLRDHERIVRCSVEAARVHLRVVGHLGKAGQYLDEAMGVTVEDGGQAWVHSRLLRAELDHRLRDASTAAETCLRVLETIVTDWDADPALAVAAAITGLAIGGRHTNAFSEKLVTILRSVTPASARLALLGDLALCVPPLDVAGDLLALVAPYDVPASPERNKDLAWLTLHEAQLRRLAGQADEAAEIATRATVMLAQADAHAWWRWLQLMEWIGPAAGDEPVPAVDPEAAPLLQAAQEIVLATRRMAIDPQETTADRLVRAETLLAATTRTTRWHALLHHTWSRLEPHHGGHGQATRLVKAAAVYGELGDEVAQEALGPHGEARRTDDVWWPQLDLYVVVEPDESLSVKVEGRPLCHLARGAPLLSALVEAVRTASNFPLVRALGSAVLSGAGVLELSQLDGLLERGRRDPLDVCVICESPPLAQLPWELLLRVLNGSLAVDSRVRFFYRVPVKPQVNRVRTRALQRALARAGFDPGPADGLFGPLTEEATKRFQQFTTVRVDGAAGPRTWGALRARLHVRHGDRRPHVIVLRRDAATERAAGRGKSLEGYDLEDLYRQVGLKVTAVRDLEALGPLASRIAEPVDVLHISTTMESTGSVPTIDFGSETYGTEGPWWHDRAESLAVTTVDRLVSEMSRTGRTPLVVLDITRPHGQSETMSQLLLRNGYAQQLTGLGQVETVIATGLSEPGRSEEASRVLVRGLAQGQTAAQIARALQRLDGQTALVSAVLPDMMLPLGT